MSFNPKDVEALLAATGRRCCICASLHNVQVHHIVPKEQDGSDEIDNAIPLCPSCHDRVHVSPSTGRTTRDYTPGELKLHRDRMISLFRATAAENIFHYESIEDGVFSRQAKTTDKMVKVELISLTEAAKKDCKALRIESKEAVKFVKGEADRHPLMFSSPFISIPLVFGENVLVLSWNCVSARIERVLRRQEAYPLNDPWSSCLGLYRKATLLPYRTHATERLMISLEEKRTLSMFEQLLQKTHEYARLLKERGTIVRTVFGLQDLLDEAKFALTNGDLGVAVASLEALLSNIHKFILAHAPQGRGAGSIKQFHAPELEAADPNKPSALIVDDEVGPRESIAMILKGSMGFQCFKASSPQEAMKYLVERDFDLITIDVLMIDEDVRMDGRELVLAAKRGGSRAKIVVATAFSGMAKQSEIGTDRFPADGYWWKASGIMKFIELINSLMRETKGGEDKDREDATSQDR